MPINCAVWPAATISSSLVASSDSSSARLTWAASPSLPRSLFTTPRTGRWQGAGERHHGNPAVCTSTVACEAWICRSHLVEQRGPFLALGYTRLGREALAPSFDSNAWIGGGVQIPRRMVVLAVIRSNDYEVTRPFELEVNQGRIPQLAALAAPGRENKGYLPSTPSRRLLRIPF